MPPTTRKTRGAFMRRPLTAKKSNLGKRMFPTWYQLRRVQGPLPQNMNQELLDAFIEFLGNKDPAFAGLPKECKDHRYNAGAKEMYDYLWSKLFKIEEKPEARKKTSTTKKAPAAKAAAVKSDDKQIKEEAPPVKVEALDDICLGGEKRMPYRKAMDSEADIDGFDPSESTYGKPKTEELPESVEAVEAPKKSSTELPAWLADIAMDELIKHVAFTWNTPEEAQLTIVAKKAYFQQP